MRLGLTYDLQINPQDERQAEWDSPRTVDVLAQSLAGLGHEVIRLGNAQELHEALGHFLPVDLVFNIAEGMRGRCREAWVPALLEARGIPYVGSGPDALAIGLDKVACKRLAVTSGIRTPRWVTVTHPQAIPASLPFEMPVIVKPRYEGSGIGIEAEAVVEDGATLRHQVQRLCARGYTSLMIEEFIPLGELTVCLIGNDPPVAYPAIQRPLDPSTRLSWHITQPAGSCWDAPLELSSELDEEARRMALRMFEVVGCRDMARVDLRVDGHGRVYFLEINPLPSLSPHDSFGLLAELLRVGFPDMLGRILEAACARLSQHDVHVASGSL